MSDPAKSEATYENLYNIPENMTGEILGGELIVTPRLSRKHGFTATVLGSRLTPPYYFGEGGGPGGWIIIIEPEIGLGKDILVPDLAGWKEERFPDSGVTTGFQWLLIGCVKYFHATPPVMTESRKCVPLPGMKFGMPG